MNKKNDLSVFHVRSNQAAINAGYKLFMGNFRILMRRTWIFGIVYALTVAIVMKTCLTILPQWLTATSMPLNVTSSPTVLGDFSQSYAVVCAATLLNFLSMLLLFAPVFSALAEHQETGSITPPRHWYGKFEWRMTLRLVILSLFLFVFYLLATAVIVLMVVALSFFVKSSVTLLMGFISILWLAALAFLLPLVYTSFKYLLNTGNSFPKVLQQTYGFGLHHWGALFLVALMVGIITLLLSAVVMLPYYILATALAKAQMGVIGGDPIGMPEYMGWMSAVVFAVSGFILGYLNISTLFPFYYLYGSFEKEEEERNQLKTNQ